MLPFLLRVDSTTANLLNLNQVLGLINSPAYLLSYPTITNGSPASRGSLAIAVHCPVNSFVIILLANKTLHPTSSRWESFGLLSINHRCKLFRMAEVCGLAHRFEFSSRLRLDLDADWRARYRSRLTACAWSCASFWF